MFKIIFKVSKLCMLHLKNSTVVLITPTMYTWTRELNMRYSSFATSIACVLRNQTPSLP